MGTSGPVYQWINLWNIVVTLSIQAISNDGLFLAVQLLRFSPPKKWNVTDVTDSSNEQADEKGREKQLAAAVMNYLNEHPHAMDTLEGIAEWWILRQRVRVDIETLTRVLERLTDYGLLERIGSGERARYRLKK